MQSDMKREYGRALASFRTHFLSSTVHFQQRNRFCTNTIKVGDEWVRASERKKQKEKQRQSPHFKHPVLFFVFVVFFYFSSWWLSSFLMKFCFHLSLYELTRFVFRLVHWAFTLMWSKSQPFHFYIVHGMFGTTSILLKIARFRVCALQYNVHICGTAKSNSIDAHCSGRVHAFRCMYTVQNLNAIIEVIRLASIRYVLHL